MIEEHEIRLDSGDTVYIKVRFNDFLKRLVIESVASKPKGKKKIEYLDCSTDYTFRELKTPDERIAYRLKKWLEVISNEHLNNALIKSWESLKPEAQ